MKKVLIADDNKQNLYMAEVLFSGNGYLVETAANGKEAIDKARLNLPDIILADILMPVMDGFALCREWRNDTQLKHIPFIFYTATYTEPKDEEFALSLGADRFVVKPVDGAELIAITEEVLKDVGNRQPEVSDAQNSDEEVYLRQYNQTLIHKLEDKLVQLEESNRKLEEEIKSRVSAEQKLHGLERQLVQLQKMEALGTLAGGIAHDFNNILMAIMGHAEIALIDTQEGIPAEKNIEQVINACKRAKELVNQILTFSRQTDMDKKPLNVKNIINEVHKLLCSSLPVNIEVKKVLKSDSFIIANPIEIYQVLMNLCTNASHAISCSEGTIEVSLTDVSLENGDDPLLGDLAPGIYQKLEVADDGSGIKTEMLNQIFNPYFTTKKKGVGTGLGLSVVQRIVQGVGGAVTVRSEIGKGTVFSIYFPVYKGDVTMEFSGAAPVKGGNEHILFVDDQQPLIELGVEMLKRLGYRVTAFNDSRKALEIFRTRPDDFDLVLTDMDMPVLSGVMLADEIIKVRSDIPVVLCTGFSDLTLEKKCQELGIKSFLMKPFVRSMLSETVRKALGKN